MLAREKGGECDVDTYLVNREVFKQIGTEQQKNGKRYVTNEKYGSGDLEKGR